jgi:uncharacterized protein (DUF302 family)
MSTYGFGKQVKMSFEEALARVTEALGKEGFGVLTQIDVAATLKAKLGKTMPPYKILGACNPSYAEKALAVEPQIGLLLPCNVLVREDQTGAVHVEIMDPLSVLNLVQREEVRSIARDVKSKLERVLTAV